MLHHYNYPASLTHFLNYHQQQFEDQSATIENEQTNSSICEEDQQQPQQQQQKGQNKSFTIAAILGLKGCNGEQGNTEGLNLSMQSRTTRLSQHHPTTSNNHFSVGIASCSSSNNRLTSLKSMKHHHLHMSPSVIANVSSKKSCKSKRVRTIFTPEQLERLEAEFERQQYMVGPERLYLAHTLQLTEAQVKVWFQNRRIKWRKHHLELTHQRLAVLKQQQILLDDNHPDGQDTNSSNSET